MCYPISSQTGQGSAGGKDCLLEDKLGVATWGGPSPFPSTSGSLSPCPLIVDTPH